MNTNELIDAMIAACITADQRWNEYGSDKEADQRAYALTSEVKQRFASLEQDKADLEERLSDLEAEYSDLRGRDA